MPPQTKPPARQTWAILIFVALLVAVVIWTANAIVAHNRLQNCIDSGRHDCIAMPDGTAG